MKCIALRRFILRKRALTIKRMMHALTEKRMTRALSMAVALMLLMSVAGCTLLNGYKPLVKHGDVAEVMPEAEADASQTPSPRVDEANNIGAFAASDLSGEPFTRESLAQSRLIMLNIWTTWCPPCLAELPHLGELARELAEKDVRIVGLLADGISSPGVADDAAIALAKSIMADKSADYTVIIPDDVLFTGLVTAIYVVPTTVFMDSYGNYVGSPVMGSKSKADWMRVINDRLAMLPDAPTSAQISQ